VSRLAVFNIAVGAILGLYLTACAFAHPIADDFIYASSVRAGLWNAWVREYVGWNGRYASNALLLTSPLAFGSLAAYRLAAAGMLAATVAAVYFFVHTLSAGGLTRQETLAGSLTLCALYVSQAPSIGESLYWYTSAAVYQAPLVIVLLHLTLVLRYTRLARPAAGDRLSLVAAALLLVIAAGFNEVIELLLLALYGILFVSTRRQAGTAHRLSGVFLAVTILCGLAVLLSPGNAVRQAMYSTRQQPARSVVMTALQTVRFTSAWVTSGSLLLATVAFVPIADKVRRRIMADRGDARECLRLAAVGLVLVVPIAVLPAYWETNVLGQHRTVNVACFSFLILWFLAAASWLGTGTRQADALKLFGHQVSAPTAVLLVLALGLTGNSYVLGSDLISGRLAAFNREMNGRYTALAACKQSGQRDCAIDEILVKPASFYIVDISDDPANWVNLSYGRYFGLMQVRLKHPGGSYVRH
jgi:hypothetical protein